MSALCPQAAGNVALIANCQSSAVESGGWGWSWAERAWRPAQPVCSPSGIPIKSTMDNPTTTQYASLMHNFVLKARSTVREIDPQNDLTFLRIRSKKNEIMVAPGKSLPHPLLGLGWQQALRSLRTRLGASVAPRGRRKA